MIRISRGCFAVCFAAVLLSTAAWADDSDGVTGYSMRLKNKSISTGDADGVQGGAVMYAAPNKQQVVVPGTMPTITPDRLWLVSIPFRFAVFAIWVR